MQKRWRPFYATDFQSLMHPCFIFCRILGIFPYKINNSIFESSKPHYVFSIIITCAVSVAELTIFYEFIILENIKNFEDVTMQVQLISSVILIALITIVTFVLSSQRMRLLQTIMEISSRLSPKSYQKLSRLIHAKDIFGFLYHISRCLICFHAVGMNKFQMIFAIYITLVIFTMDMLYTNCVCTLKACFKEINENLLHMQKIIVNSEQHVPKIIFYYDQTNPILIMKLKALKRQHLMISNTVQMLNIIFSLQLLATIVLTFVEMICGLYFSVVRWQNGLFITLDHPQIGLTFLTAMIYNSLKIGLLVWVCETGKNEAQEIRTIIHDVLNSTKNKQIKDELQLFSLQILHRKNIFSAKVINVDATFFTTMTGTITTYMLILLQFLIISHSCDENSAINITQVIHDSSIKKI